MARDSSGTYTRVSNSFSNPVANTAISPTDASTYFDDIQTEMTDSLSRSNKGSMLANLSMGGFAITTATSVQFKGSSSGFTVLAPSAAASGTLTLPAATDTLMGKATTDILTNKTFDTAGTGNSFSVAGTAITAKTGSGSVVLATTPTITTPSISGTMSCASIASTGAILSSGAGNGIGYTTGAGGTVTQGTSKSTGVTLNTICGAITMNNASLAAATVVSFPLTNSAIAATDMVLINYSGGTSASYTVSNNPASGSVSISVRNNTAGPLSEALVLQFVVIKAATS